MLILMWLPEYSRGCIYLCVKFVKIIHEWGKISTQTKRKKFEDAPKMNWYKTVVKKPKKIGMIPLSKH